MVMYVFDAANLPFAPETHGIYWLYGNGQLIYIGRAAGVGVTLRSRLTSHLSGNEGKCTRSATHFECMSTTATDAIIMEERLLNQYRSKYGRLPRCNDRVG